CQNREGNFLTAPRKTDSGVVTITAPMVPPRTIRAAVTCCTSLSLPPSSNRPPRIPAKASRRPRTVERSIFPFLFMAASAFRGKHRAAEGADPLYHFIRRFEHHEALAGGQDDDRIGRYFNMFDKIRVQHDGDVIEAG